MSLDSLKIKIVKISILFNQKKVIFKNVQFDKIITSFLKEFL